MEELCIFGGLFFVLFGLCTNSAEARENKKIENTFITLGLVGLLCFIIGGLGVIIQNI